MLEDLFVVVYPRWREKEIWLQNIAFITGLVILDVGNLAQSCFLFTCSSMPDELMAKRGNSLTILMDVFVILKQHFCKIFQELSISTRKSFGAMR